MTALEELDPLYHFNTHYPDRLSLLDPCYSAQSPLDKKPKNSRIARRKNNPRYKTQPITFDEIKEVEEPVTPSNENNNYTTLKSFLTKLQIESSDLTAESRLHPNKTPAQSELTGIGRDGSAANIWYDSPYPTKLSFLDMPEACHHNTNPKKQSEKEKMRSRAARRRNNPRYKTQPITFDEIKEVEEPENNGDQENMGEAVVANVPAIDVIISSSKEPKQPLVPCGYAR